MRVLHWLNTYLPDIGGIQTLCQNLLPRQQDALGYDVLMIAGHTTSNMPDRMIQDGIDVRRHPLQQALTGGSPRAVLESNAWVAKTVAEFEPDIIHLHPCGGEFAFLTRLRQRHPIPFVVTVHNNYSSVIDDIGASVFNAQGLTPAAEIAACSEDAASYVRAGVPEVAHKLSTVPNGIAELDAVPPPPPQDSPVLLYAGRLAEQKRLDRMLEAFDLLAERHPDVILRIAGDGHMRRPLLEQHATLRHGDRVQFLGPVDPERVPGLLDDTTVFVLTSDYEGLPIVALEAIRHGRPIVSTDAGGTGEAIRDGVTGRLLPLHDTDGLPQALADAIHAILTTPGRAEEMGRAARELFEQKYSLDRCVDAYDAMYRRVLAGDRPPAASETSPDLG